MQIGMRSVSTAGVVCGLLVPNGILRDLSAFVRNAEGLVPTSGSYFPETRFTVRWRYAVVIQPEMASRGSWAHANGKHSVDLRKTGGLFYQPAQALSHPMCNFE